MLTPTSVAQWAGCAPAEGRPPLRFQIGAHGWGMYGFSPWMGGVREANEGANDRCCSLSFSLTSPLSKNK